MSNIVSPQNSSFSLADGFRPAKNGTLYIGVAGTDPTVAANRLAISGRKSDGAVVPLTQPIALSATGTPMDGNGNPVDLLVDTHYSFATFDYYGKLQQNISTKIILEVDGFVTLRSVPVLYEGQRIKLLGWDKGSSLGGGEFIGHVGTAADDGGHIASSGRNWFWERVADKVNVLDYGIKISSRLKGSEIYFDVTTALQNATKRAIEKEWELISPFTFSNDPGTDSYPRFGFYISKTWDITGLKALMGQFNILVKASEMSVNGTVPIGGTIPYSIVSLNCKWGTNGKIFSTSIGQQIIDKLIVINIEGVDNSPPLNGVLFINSGSRFNFILANSFNGTGIHFADSYDNHMQDIRVLYCGNKDRFALDVSSWKADSTSRGDESNANTFVGIVTHNSREKSWFIAGTKQNVIRIHDEALLIKTNTPTNPSGIENRNGYGYTSCYFSSIGGHLGVVSFSTFDSASTFDPVLTLGAAVNCSCDNIASTVTGGNVTIIAGDPGPTGGSFIGSVTCKNFRTNPSSNSTISSVRAASGVFIDPKTVVQVGNFSGDLQVQSTFASGTIENLTVGGTTTLSTAVLAYNCTFNGPIIITADGASTITNRMRHVFEHCVFKSTISISTSRCHFKECGLISQQSFTVSGDEGVKIENCRLNVPIVINGTARLELSSVDPSGSSITSSSSGLIDISNCNWSSGVVTTTNNSASILIRDNSTLGSFNGFVNAKIFNSTIVNNLTIGTNGRWIIQNGILSTLTIDGTGINLDVAKTNFNVLNFVAGSTGVWRFDTSCLAWTSANWITPTTTAGYGARTYDISTGTIYKISSGNWVKVVETIG